MYGEDKERDREQRGQRESEIDRERGKDWKLVGNSERDKQRKRDIEKKKETEIHKSYLIIQFWFFLISILQFCELQLTYANKLIY